MFVFYVFLAMPAAETGLGIRHCTAAMDSLSMGPQGNFLKGGLQGLISLLSEIDANGHWSPSGRKQKSK